VARQITEFGRDGRPATPDGGLDSPAFHRNHQPIWAVLGKFLQGRTGDVLEAGSGTGQHVVYFARQNPGITWWPSDLSEANLKSIAAWRAGAALPNIRPPQRIDLSDPAWSVTAADGSAPGKLLAVFCANVIHIAPWRVAEGWSRARRASCARTGGCSSTGRSSATAGIPPSATRCSTPA
jgi:hypothetical protein